jgi:hypothetical protein
MKSLRIIFNETGAILDLNTEVSGFNAVNQDCLVNLGTRKGSDKVDPQRGSSLERIALQSSVIVSTQAATHLANIAASETSFYIQSSEDPEETDKLQDIELETISLVNQSLELNTLATSENGELLGTKVLIS